MPRRIEQKLFQKDTSQQNWSGEEESDQEEDVREGRERYSWQGEVESQFDLEEEGYEYEHEHGEFAQEGEQDQFVEPYTPKSEIVPYREKKLWCEETDSQTILGEINSYKEQFWNH